MFIFRKEGVPYLSWGPHELSSCWKGDGIDLPIFNEEGQVVGAITTTKRGGNHPIPEKGWFVRRVEVGYGQTESGDIRFPYVGYDLLRLPDLAVVVHICPTAKLEEVGTLPIPEKVRECVAGVIEQFLKRGKPGRWLNGWTYQACPPRSRGG